jgi:hypothetical protein
MHNKLKEAQRRSTNILNLLNFHKTTSLKTLMLNNEMESCAFYAYSNFLPSNFPPEKKEETKE